MEQLPTRKKVIERGGMGAGAMVILIVLELFTFIALVTLFDLNFLESMIVAATLLLGFLIILLATPRERKIIVQRAAPRPVEMIVEKPVEKTVVKEVVQYVDRPVKEQKKPIANGVHHAYVASTDSKMFHPTSSRLARLIRPKNRVYGDTYKEMQRKGFKPSQRAKEFLKKHKK